MVANISHSHEEFPELQMSFPPEDSAVDMPELQSAVDYIPVGHTMEEIDNQFNQFWISTIMPPGHTTEDLDNPFWISAILPSIIHQQIDGDGAPAEHMTETDGAPEHTTEIDGELEQMEQMD